MLEKATVLGTITILADQSLQVRVDTVVLDDGVELSRTYHRYVVTPGDDVSSRPKMIQDLAALLWTPGVLEFWRLKQQKMKEEIEARTRLQPPPDMVP